MSPQNNNHILWAIAAGIIVGMALILITNH